MQLCDLGSGFGIVPLAESNVSHTHHIRRQLRREFDGRDLNAPLCARQRRWIAAHTDVMAIQASAILRDVLSSIYNGEFEQ